jgi:CheY-like chemotaxis protein
MDDFDDLTRSHRPPTAARPLLGCTMLLVEDSRFASEAVRLLALRSGARIRRADTLAAAERHLKVYRPAVVLVDVGLPDGDGAELIRTLDLARPRVTAVIGTSGDPDSEALAMGAGADGFIAKPVSSLAAFQEAILRHLPAEAQPPSPRALPHEQVEPDRIAFRDDLAHVATLLEERPEGGSAADEGLTRYISQFLSGVARSVGDEVLTRAACDLARKGTPLESRLTALAGLVQDRMGDRRAL